jgi:hypothetical protein
MIRSEWEEVGNPHLMLGCLRNVATDRKLRLFGIACWLESKQTLAPDARKALGTVEQYADGLLGAEDLWSAFGRLPDVPGRRLAVPRSLDVDDARRVSRWTICPTEALPEPRGGMWYYVPRLDGYHSEQLAHGRLLQCLFGEPWRRVRFAPTWRTPDACSLAEAALERRDPSTGHLDPVRMALLGDALEDAGCSDRAVLEHCRAGGPHVYGCWVVDRILGQE